MLRDVAAARPKKAIDINKVVHIDVLEECSILLLLSKKTIYQVPIAGLEPESYTIANKQLVKIMHSSGFFKAGTCLKQTLVCAIKQSVFSSTVVIYKVQGLDSVSTIDEPIQSGTKSLLPFKVCGFQCILVLCASLNSIVIHIGIICASRMHISSLSPIQVVLRLLNRIRDGFSQNLGNAISA
jgi:hypothetical protein